MSTTPDKYSAVWVSHTSLSDFMACPRAYYLKHMYKDPSTGRKMKVISPALSLGQVVHEVLESLSVVPTQERFNASLMDAYELAWEKVAGKKGGFLSDESESKFKERGREMLSRVIQHPGPLKNLAVKIKKDLPYYWLSEEDEIILCGKIDWLEYFPEEDSVGIIDFKTGKTEENAGSLQLPIYYLLATHCQSRPVVKASYWYLARDSDPIQMPLPEIDEARERVMKIAKEVKLARKLERFKCPLHTGCYVCKPMEAVLRGEAELVGVDSYNTDVFILDRMKEEQEESQESEIL